MAISNNVLLNAVTGTINKQLVVRQYGGKTVLSKYPDMSRRKLSVKQKQMNTLMEQANYEARTIVSDEELCTAAQVRLDVTRKQLYRALIKEYLKNNYSSTPSKRKKQ